jgi:hypothetical protein
MKRFISGLGLVALLLAFASPAAMAQIVINEIRIDNTSTDTDEFFEVLGPASAPLDSLWYVVIGDGAGGSGVVEMAASLDGLSLKVNGVLAVLNSSNVPQCTGYDTTLPLVFENSDNVTHMLVRNWTGNVGDDLDTNDDGVLDITPWDEVVDCVALIETVGSGDLVYCDTQVGPDGPYVPGHVFRCGSNWLIGAFDPVCQDMTPGEPNNCSSVSPEVYSLQYSPCVPLAANSVDLTVIATDVNNDITGVRAFYKLSTDAQYDSLDMSVVVDSLYSVSLPSQADQSLVQFYVQARDAQGNVTSSPSSAPSFVRTYRVGYQTIASIQGNTVADSCLSSALLGQAVNVTGVVTHEAYEFSDDFFYIQRGTGPNSGIKIFAPDSAFVPTLGDSVVISGYVEEYNCVTEVVMFAGCGQVVGTGKVVPRTLTSLADVTNEINESMLVTITGPLTAVSGFDTTTVGSNDFVEFRVHASGDTAWVGDDTFFPDGIGYSIVPEPGMGIDALTGIVGYRYPSTTDATTNLRLEPRRNNDVDRNWTDVGDGTDVVDAIRAYRLGQNRPNPFNPVTSIEFEVPQPGRVTLTVYDVTGRLVRRLVAREYSRPTRDRAVWSGLDEQGKEVPSGVYFYRIEADNYSATRKMLLLK